MAELKMPGKGGAAAMLQELNAEEAPAPVYITEPSNYLTGESVSPLDDLSISETDSEADSETSSPSVSKQGSSAVSETVSEADRSSVSKAGSKKASPSVSKSAGKSAGRTAAEGVARSLGKGQMIAVGIKMPEDLSDYLDAAAFARKKQKVLKQDLIRRAIQLLVVELESGEELADLNG